MDASEFKAKQLLEAAGATDRLTDREKHLIGLAVTLTRGCTVCSGGRIEQAMAAGIEYETIRDAIDLTAAVNAGVTLRTAIEGVRQNGLEGVCQGAECRAVGGS
ncbi:MAG: carboxymuconolactone decarboxylase family protein [Planctomycetota bacterium]